MRKIYIFLVLILLSIVSVNSATEIISLCVGNNTQNNTEYILSPLFSPNLNPCFDLSNTNNIIINGNGTNRIGSTDLIIKVSASNNNLEIKNFHIDNLGLQVTGWYNTLKIHDNYIYNGRSFMYTGYLSGIPNTNHATALIEYQALASQTGVSYNWFEINNNRFDSNVHNVGQLDERVLFFFSGNRYGVNLNLHDNSFIGWGLGSRVLNNAGGSGLGEFYLESLNMQNNIFMRFANALTFIAFDLQTSTCNNFTISPDNLFTHFTQTDINQDSTTDSINNMVISGCTVLNNPLPTRKLVVNPSFYTTTNPEYVVTTSLTQNTLSNTNYILGKPLVLNSTEYINFNNVQNSVLDISRFVNENALDIKSLNGVRLGIGNNLYGGTDLANKPIIISSGTIYTNPSFLGWIFNSGIGLIDTDNSNIIENIYFNLGGTGSQNFMLISNSLTGSSLTFKNNKVEYNMANPFVIDDNIPFAHDQVLDTLKVTYASEITNNVFELNKKTNSVFMFVGDGNWTKATIKDNTFKSVPYLFAKMLDYNQSLPIELIHNNFLQDGLDYSYPFNLTNINSTASNVVISGKYIYQATSCDSYVFDMGNRYEDLTDNSGCTANSLNFCNQNPILRTNIGSNPTIYDNYSIFSYPYNFAGNTGSGVYLDLCTPFTFTVYSPINNSNYQSSSALNINWKYTSPDYTDLSCIEYFNNVPLIIRPSVNNNQIINYAVTLTSGLYNYKIVCENEIITKTHELTFTVDNSTVISIIPPVIVSNVYGCTNSNATNYNPSATIDDGSCTFGTTPPINNGTGGTGLNSGSVDFINPNSITGTSASTVGFVADLTNGITSIAIPLGIFVFIVLVLFTLFAIF